MCHVEYYTIENERERESACVWKRTEKKESFALYRIGERRLIFFFLTSIVPVKMTGLYTYGAVLLNSICILCLGSTSKCYFFTPRPDISAL